MKAEVPLNRGALTKVIDSDKQTLPVADFLSLTVISSLVHHLYRCQKCVYCRHFAFFFLLEALTDGGGTAGVDGSEHDLGSAAPAGF